MPRLSQFQSPTSPSNLSSNALFTYVSSFCCPVFGGQCFLFSPLIFFFHCPLHLCVQLLLPGIWRQMFLFSPIIFPTMPGICRPMFSFLPSIFSIALCTFVFFIFRLALCVYISINNVNEYVVVEYCKDYHGNK